MSRLSQIVPSAHDYLGEVLLEGDFVVDLTAGNGHDTLFLRRCVGESGIVVSFDLQAQALDMTAARLSGEMIPSSRRLDPPDEWRTGVHLIHAGHERLHDFISQPLAGVIANLGYLPGGDKNVVTRPNTTLAALECSAALLKPGGRLSVVVYPGHVGGQEEAAAVDHWFSALPVNTWDVLRMSISNHPDSPFLQIAGKK